MAQNSVITGGNEHPLSHDLRFTVDTLFLFAADLHFSVALHAELCTFVSTLEPSNQF
jgi:hypothetical protein